MDNICKFVFQKLFHEKKNIVYPGIARTLYNYDQQMDFLKGITLF